jgi:hypothetical protein
MTEQKKDLDIAKVGQELTGAIEGKEAEKSEFLANLSDDMLDKVSGGLAPQHIQCHGNLSEP